MVEAAQTNQESDSEEMTYGEYMLQSARLGELDAIKECLAEEVPINFQDEEAGNSALHLASANGYKEIVEYLLDNGAEINQLNKSKNTPLHWAALLGQTDIVKLLCEWHTQKPESEVKARTDIKNEFGRIAMEEALQGGKSEIAEYLAEISTLEDDKVYSTITEAQIYNEEERKDDNRSIQSEEAIKPESEEIKEQELTEEQIERRTKQKEIAEAKKLEDLGNEIKEKMNMHEFDVKVTKTEESGGK